MLRVASHSEQALHVRVIRELPLLQLYRRRPGSERRIGSADLCGARVLWPGLCGTRLRMLQRTKTLGAAVKGLGEGRKTLWRLKARGTAEDTQSDFTGSTPKHRKASLEIIPPDRTQTHCSGARLMAANIRHRQNGVGVFRQRRTRAHTVRGC